MKRNQIEVSRAADVCNIVMLVFAVICLLAIYFSRIYTTHVADSVIAYHLTNIYYSQAFNVVFTLCNVGLLVNLARHMQAVGEQLSWLLYGLAAAAIIVCVIGVTGYATPTLNIIRRVANFAYNMLLVATGIMFTIRYEGRLRSLGVASLVLIGVQLVIAMFAASLLNSVGVQTLSIVMFLLNIITLLFLQRTMVAKKAETL